MRNLITIVETANGFSDWFGNSRVVDAEGQPLPHWPCFGSPPEMGEKLVSTVIEKLRAGELLDA